MTVQLANMPSEHADHATVARRVALLRRAIELIKTKPKVWFWDDSEGEWIGAIAVDEMVGNHERVFRIDPLDGRPEQLAFGWQVHPYSRNAPPAPDLVMVR